ncbi:MAG: leucyl aminopeptidase family protein [Candidatus Puniceispirillaceae bacterium]
MTAKTYADFAYPSPDEATPDDTLLVIINANEADNWRGGLPSYQQAYLSTTGAKMTPGSHGLLLSPDGLLESAYLIISDDIMWQAASAAKHLPAGRYKLDESAHDDNIISSVFLGFYLARYRPHLLDDEAPQPAIATCHLSRPQPRAKALGRATILCRDLINAPSNMMTPKALADEARALATQFNATIKVTSGDDLADKFPAIHTVGRAAEVPPCLIDMTWGKKGPQITLIGKGVTFDSGGLDLKPSKAMEIMKKDMGGSAHVLGLAMAIMMADLPVRLRVLIGAAENAVSEKSMRPLDVINTRAGIKVEVGNTDAEGRLVLADAISLALEDKPDFMVDFATLTGAARVALGTQCPALFCNDDATARAIMKAGQAEGDPLWQLPLFEPYDSQLDAGHMALSSTGSSGYGGAITAALFLRRFAGKQVNWAHIDVMAWNLSSRPGRPKGGEAMGLRALYHFIEQLCA